MISVSVIMPIYNAELTLEMAIESVLKQTFTDFELLLIDDGSNDSSGTICDTYAHRDKRIRVFHQENSGRCIARNLGIKHAVGKYISFIDNDDMYRPELLDHNFHLAEKYDADIVKFGHDSIPRDQFNYNCYIKNKASTSNESVQVINRADLAIQYKEIKWRFDLVFVWDKLFRRNFLLEYNILFDADFKRADEDQAFCMKAYQFLNKMLINQKKYYCYIQRKDSLSGSFSMDIFTDLNLLISYEADLFKKLNIKAVYPVLWMERLSDYFIRVIHDIRNPDVNLTFDEMISILDDLRNNDFFIGRELLSTCDNKRHNIKKRIYIWLFFKKHMRILICSIIVDRFIKKIFGR